MTGVQRVTKPISEDREARIANRTCAEGTAGAAARSHPAAANSDTSVRGVCVAVELLGGLVVAQPGNGAEQAGRPVGVPVVVGRTTEAPSAGQLFRVGVGRT